MVDEVDIYTVVVGGMIEDLTLSIDTVVGVGRCCVTAAEVVTMTVVVV